MLRDSKSPADAVGAVPEPCQASVEVAELENRQPAPGIRLPSIALAVFVFVVLLHCIWVLRLPVFPSQDGPMHMYLVNIMRQLLLHERTVYTNNFYISHYVPPYSLYYYGLIAISSICSLDMADKIMVCLSIVVFAFGIRTLIRTVRPGAVWSTFLVLPIVLNWPLLMGFVNYTLATGIGCFALAVWCGAADLSRRNRYVAFLALSTLAVITHPVPWMFIAGFAWFDLAIRALRKGRSGHFSMAWKQDAIAAAICSSGFFYLRTFSKQRVVASQAKTTLAGTIRETPERLREYLKGHGLVIFTGSHDWANQVHRAVLGLLFIAAVAFTVRELISFTKQNGWNSTKPEATKWAAFACLFLLVLPAIPASLNGSYYFADRLLSLIFVSMIVGCAPAFERSKAAAPIAAVALAITLFDLAQAEIRFHPIADQIVSLDRAPLVVTDKPGLLARFPTPSYWIGVASDPYAWAAARYFRIHGMLMYNTPWLELAIIPVKPNPTGLSKIDSSFNIGAPVYGTGRFSSPAQERQTLSRVGVAIGMRKLAPMSEQLFGTHPGDTEPAVPAKDWRCISTRAYELCVPPGTQFESQRTR